MHIITQSGIVAETVELKLERGKFGGSNTIIFDAGSEVAITVLSLDAKERAAPDLLTALERLAGGCQGLIDAGALSDDGPFADAIKQADDAIAKARG